jgi:hypothetical protein
MRSLMRTTSLILLASLLAACGGGHHGDDDGDDAGNPDAAVAPVFRNARTDMTDQDVAMQSLQLLGAQVSGADTNCNVCHALSRTKLHSWLTLSQASMSGCLTDLAVTDQTTAQTMVACLQNGSGVFAPSQTGIYAIAAKLDWFKYLFDLATPGDTTQYDDFIGRVSMPRGSHPAFTQDQFDIIAEWVSRGMPLVDTLVPDDTSGSCTPSITQAMTDHINALATTGWTAVNAAAGIDMFGCAGAATTRDCLGTYPLASSTAYGANWMDDFPGGNLRVLRVNHYQSSYWTRSSADGRFVAHGGSQIGGASSTIVDLERDVEIGTTAFYDPGFFPSNTGFAFQGSTPHLCDQSILSGLAANSVLHYSTTPQCSDNGSIGLYQHLGAGLNGTDYWTVNGQWENDNGGYDVVNDTVPGFPSNATITLNRMTFNGTTFVAAGSTQEAVPYEGDTVISPSTTILVSRLNTSGALGGFKVHAINTPLTGTAATDLPTIATYCLAGDKPAFSFDERFMVVHHYVTDADAVDLGFSSASDAGFQAYRTQHASNIYIVDLLTGEKTRVTRMAPGQFALFPHFRSDGWLYFLVRAPGGNGDEYIVASDAGFVIAGN